MSSIYCPTCHAAPIIGDEYCPTCHRLGTLDNWIDSLPGYDPEMIRRLEQADDTPPPKPTQKSRTYI